MIGRIASQFATDRQRAGVNFYGNAFGFIGSISVPGESHRVTGRDVDDGRTNWNWRQRFACFFSTIIFHQIRDWNTVNQIREFIGVFVLPAQMLVADKVTIKCTVLAIQ